MYRGMGDTSDYYQPGSWWCNNMPSWLMTGNQLAVCTAGTPVVPSAPTQAQLAAVANSADPGTAASVLAQTLSNQAVTDSQAANAAAVAATAGSPYPTLGLPSVPGVTTPFCGDGSIQMISGIDNCTLLIGAGLTVLGVFAFAEISAAKGRR